MPINSHANPVRHACGQNFLELLLGDDVTNAFARLRAKAPHERRTSADACRMRMLRKKFETNQRVAAASRRSMIRIHDSHLAGLASEFMEKLDNLKTKISQLEADNSELKAESNRNSTAELIETNRKNALVQELRADWVKMAVAFRKACPAAFNAYSEANLTTHHETPGKQADKKGLGVHFIKKLPGGGPKKTQRPRSPKDPINPCSDSRQGSQESRLYRLRS